MKKILLLGIAALFCVNAVTAQSKGVNFQSGTLKEILAKAAGQKKYVFLDVYTTWCPPCKFMTANIFPLANVGEYFNKTFVSAKFDAENGEGVAIAKKFGVRAYPTFLILDAHGTEVGRVVGGVSSAGESEDFIQRVKDVLAH